MQKTIADQHPHGALCVSRIPLEEKKRFPEVLLVPVEYRRSKTRQVALRAIPLSAEIRTPQEQLSPEHPSSKEQ
jgi:hypothetical protein